MAGEQDLGASAFEQVTRERVDNQDKHITSVKDAVNGIWKAIDAIKKEIHEEVLKRLPPWVTVVISSMTMAMGGMAVLLIEHASCIGR